MSYNKSRRDGSIDNTEEEIVITEEVKEVEKSKEGKEGKRGEEHTEKSDVMYGDSSDLSDEFLRLMGSGKCTGEGASSNFNNSYVKHKNESIKEDLGTKFPTRLSRIFDEAPLPEEVVQILGMFREMNVNVFSAHSSLLKGILYFLNRKLLCRDGDKINQTFYEFFQYESYIKAGFLAKGEKTFVDILHNALNVLLHGEVVESYFSIAAFRDVNPKEVNAKFDKNMKKAKNGEGFIIYEKENIVLIAGLNKEGEFVDTELTKKSNLYKYITQKGIIKDGKISPMAFHDCRFELKNMVLEHLGYKKLMENKELLQFCREQLVNDWREQDKKNNKKVLQSELYKKFESSIEEFESVLGRASKNQLKKLNYEQIETSIAEYDKKNDLHSFMGKTNEERGLFSKCLLGESVFEVNFKDKFKRNAKLLNEISDYMAEFQKRKAQVFGSSSLIALFKAMKFVLPANENNSENINECKKKLQNFLKKYFINNKENSRHLDGKAIAQICCFCQDDKKVVDRVFYNGINWFGKKPSFVKRLMDEEAVKVFLKEGNTAILKRLLQINKFKPSILNCLKNAKQNEISQVAVAYLLGHNYKDISNAIWANDNIEKKIVLEYDKSLLVPGAANFNALRELYRKSISGLQKKPSLRTKSSLRTSDVEDVQASLDLCGKFYDADDNVDKGRTTQDIEITTKDGQKKFYVVEREFNRSNDQYRMNDKYDKSKGIVEQNREFLTKEGISNRKIQTFILFCVRQGHGALVWFADNFAKWFGVKGGWFTMGGAGGKGSRLTNCRTMDGNDKGKKGLFFKCNLDKKLVELTIVGKTNDILYNYRPSFHEPIKERTDIVANIHGDDKLVGINAKQLIVFNNTKGNKELYNDILKDLKDNKVSLSVQDGEARYKITDQNVLKFRKLLEKLSRNRKSDFAKLSETAEKLINFVPSAFTDKDKYPERQFANSVLNAYKRKGSYFSKLLLGRQALWQKKLFKKMLFSMFSLGLGSELIKLINEKDKFGKKKYKHGRARKEILKLVQYELDKRINTLNPFLATKKASIDELIGLLNVFKNEKSIVKRILGHGWQKGWKHLGRGNNLYEKLIATPEGIERLAKIVGDAEKTQNVEKTAQNNANAAQGVISKNKKLKYRLVKFVVDILKSHAGEMAVIETKKDREALIALCKNKFFYEKIIKEAYSSQSLLEDKREKKFLTLCDMNLAQRKELFPHLNSQTSSDKLMNEKFNNNPLKNKEPQQEGDGDKEQQKETINIEVIGKDYKSEKLGFGVESLKQSGNTLGSKNTGKGKGEDKERQQIVKRNYVKV